MPEPEGRFDRLVILRGAAVGCLLAVPATLANSALSGKDGRDGAVALTFLAVLVGFLLAGFAAGLDARSEPSRHGALAGLAAFVPVELLAILGRMGRGAPIRLVGIVLLALLAAWVGSLGALLGARRRDAKARRAAADSTPPTPLEGS